MNIILNPKLENLNQYEQWIEEIEQKIDMAAQQLDRGEGIDGETAINQLREHIKSIREKMSLFSAVS